MSDEKPKGNPKPPQRPAPDDDLRDRRRIIDDGPKPNASNRSPADNEN